MILYYIELTEHCFSFYATGLTLNEYFLLFDPCQNVQ